MYYTYVLLSDKDSQFYSGYTNNLKERLFLHRFGKVNSTCKRLPLRLVYYECCLNQYDALHREKFFKTGLGKRYLNKRLRLFLESIRPQAR